MGKLKKNREKLKHIYLLRRNSQRLFRLVTDTSLLRFGEYKDTLKG